MEQNNLKFTEEELEATWERIVLRKTKSNNWLKMHGYPMRRKPRGTRKKKNKSYVFVDEAHLLVRNTDTQDFVANLYSRARRFDGSDKTK